MDCKEFRSLIRTFLDDSLDEFRLTFDVDRDLADLMELERKRLRGRNAFKKTAIASEIFTVAAFLIVMTVILFYQ